jgi:uncharacterized protein YPO0396
MQRVLEYEQHAAACLQRAAETKNAELKKQLEEAAQLWERLAALQRQGVTEKRTQFTLTVSEPGSGGPWWNKW